jgi:CheY-like chemotaxis protein
MYVGDDSDVQARVSRAIETAWSGSRAPDYRATATDVLLEATEDADLQLLADACGIVTTIEAATDTLVADRLAATPKSVPVIVVLETATAELFRIALRAGADDVVTKPVSEAIKSGSDTDPLVERLLDAVEPRRVQFGSDDAERLREILLDSGPTLVSTRSDEVDTKISWTMENVGEHAELNRIVCYLREGETFDPAYVWCPEGHDTELYTIDESPDTDRLSTFENVVRPSVPPELVDHFVGESGTSDEEERYPTATVHVPLVAD